MIEREVIGTYLGRSIQAIRCSSNDECIFKESDPISGSTVLFMIGKKTGRSDFQRCLEDIAKQSPLAILVAGHNAEPAFDLLLHWLDQNQGQQHVMTKIYKGRDLSELAHEFLASTWPSEDRFDEWQNYTLVSHGSNDLDYSEFIKKMRTSSNS
jgi:hypothetical protein